MIPARENLRSGYTTGACAAAASKGALLALIHQRPVSDVRIHLPGGTSADFVLRSCVFTESEGKGSVVKDAGDDPDVTDKAEVCARVWWSTGAGIAFQRGTGVGLVTKMGLPVAVGEPAINPAPRRLIAETLVGVLDENSLQERGLVVEISVPRGEELAKKTFNGRLGIVGGISILGTTGIVTPYSTTAWLASIVQGIDVAVAQGVKRLVLTVGERGERFARKLFPWPEEAFVQIGPFFGDALRHCAEAGVQMVVLAAMVGKLAKFAAGHESVHSSNGSQDFLFLAEVARSAGAGAALASQIEKANTAQEVSGLISQEGLERFYHLICEKAWNFAVSLVRGGCTIQVLLTGQDGSVLGSYPV